MSEYETEDLPVEAGRSQHPGGRTRLRRRPDRGRHDLATVEAILDEAIVGYVGWVADGQPYVTPTSIWRQGDRVYWHGSAASRMIRACDGQPVCVTVAHVDGLVMARSGTNHSVNYRSVMVFGTAHLVTDPAEAEAALETMLEFLYPGRWPTLRPMTAKELKATAVMWVAIDEASAKIRADLNHDDEGDETWPVWGGVIPVRIALGAPEPDPFTPDGMPAPAVRFGG